MSWSERIDNIKFSIKTGDGKTFFPLWKFSEKSKAYNVSKYDYINQKGSFVDRKQAQGGIYPLVFWFQGDDNVEQANDFEKSADDNRIWTINHPFYGTIKGQPSNFKRVDTVLNTTEITVDFWESLEEDFPASSISTIDEVRSKVNAVDLTSRSFMVENSNPSLENISTIQDSLNVSTSKLNVPITDFESFSNNLSIARNSVKDLVSNTSSVYENIQKVFVDYGDYSIPVKEKVGNLVKSYNSLKDNINSLFDKFNFETQGSNLICSMCLSSVNPMEGDYITRSNVKEINSLIVNTYNDYLTTLDSLQVDVYDVNNSWSPNVNIQFELSGLVSFTLKSLFIFAFEAKQEKTIELTENSNLILLTHRYMGLDENDNNIATFRMLNNIKNDEILEIKKGRLITYFV